MFIMHAFKHSHQQLVLEVQQYTWILIHSDFVSWAKADFVIHQHQNEKLWMASHLSRHFPCL